jgi:adenylate cyclase
VIAFSLASPDWIGPVRELSVYWVIGLAVLGAGTVSDTAARRTSWAVAMLDPPMLFWLVLGNAAALEAAGYPSQGYAVRLGAGCFFLLVVLLSSLSLDVRLVALTGAVAAACQVALLALGTPDLTWVLFLPLAFAIAVMTLAYTIARTQRLVRSVATEELRRAHLGRYFPPQVASQVDLESDAMREGETREVTIVFCDIRGFTRLAAALDSRAVVATLNDFHARMVDAIFEHGGTLDKFMGDGLMAYFGAPLHQPDHAARAVRCAVRMERALAALNAERAASGREAIAMGIGIHTGTVLLADIGAPGRRDYTAIGDAVNVAARLEQATKEQDVAILVSDETRRLAGDAVSMRPAMPAAIRGKAAPVACWTPGDSSIAAPTAPA